ncbi:MAG: sigma-70 family RNA polymerase sigma factor [Salinivirgaceae bacterium]
MTSEEFKEKVFVLKDKLYRFSKQILADDMDAQDAVQDVLMKLWTVKDELQRYESIEAFAMTMTKNRCLDKLRQKKVRYEKSDDLRRCIETVDNSNRYENQEINELLRKSIQTLTEPQKTIMYLRDIEGYEFEEIEPLVDMKTETIRVNLSRARKKVREELNKIISYGTIGLQ